jgi:EAL domain-containing protein (putative c-di-GMP-specific phosphodiesterase class I)
LELWHDQAPAADLVLNVNVSTRQIERHGFLAVVDDLVAHGLDPASLILEITETALAPDGDTVMETLNAINARGIRLALDDFGTGYSSLSRLHAAPVSHLKLDRSFVSQIEADAHMVPIVDATVAIADGLGLGVIAEGVETGAQLHHLCGRSDCCLYRSPHPGRGPDAAALHERAVRALHGNWPALLTAAQPSRRSPRCCREQGG